jgi:hypothetical protein
MVLVDANVILDIITADPVWFDWSAKALEKALGKGLAINPVIYAEVGAGFRKETELEAALDWNVFERLELPYTAAFRAGQAYVQYRRQGGNRRSPLPDFYIGAHAEAEGMTLLTRDAARYRSYFPKVKLITPG